MAFAGKSLDPENVLVVWMGLSLVYCGADSLLLAAGAFEGTGKFGFEGSSSLRSITIPILRFDACTGVRNAIPCQ